MASSTRSVPVRMSLESATDVEEVSLENNWRALPISGMVVNLERYSAFLQTRAE